MGGQHSLYMKINGLWEVSDNWNRTCIRSIIWKEDFKLTIINWQFTRDKNSWQETKTCSPLDHIGTCIHAAKWNVSSKHYNLRCAGLNIANMPCSVSLWCRTLSNSRLQSLSLYSPCHRLCLLPMSGIRMTWWSPNSTDCYYMYKYKRHKRAICYK